MNKIRLITNVAAFFVFALALSSSAQAVSRTWVSGVGDDLNPCSRTAPCKTYSKAHSVTDIGGEISTLDPGGFGTVTITKSITINGTPGSGYGSILASNANGITVNITSASDTQKMVRLNWLDINGAPQSLPGLNGVRVVAATTVIVENSSIAGFRASSLGNGNGITVLGASSLIVRNTDISNCLNAGINTSTTSGVIAVDIDGVLLTKNGQGFVAGNGTRGSIRNSHLSLNTTGLQGTESAIDTEINVQGCQISGNLTGIQSGSGAAIVRIADNYITQNVTGLSAAGGAIESSGNNVLVGNTTPGAPTGPAPPRV